MQTARLIAMANQIAINLVHDHDPVAALAEHIRLFWDPRMISALIQAKYLSDDIVIGAVRILNHTGPETGVVNEH